MDRDFEKYMGGPTEALAERLRVSINRGRAILLNRNIYHRLGRPEAVLLGYSRTRDTIAVEPASPRLNESFPVIKNGTNWRINAAPFCRHFNIRIDTPIQFVQPEIEGTSLYLNLAQVVTVGGWKQRRRNK